MKYLFILSFLFVCEKAGAQLTLEHSYLGNYPMQLVKLEVEGYKYAGFDTATRQMKIYNTDHSLWKTINTSIPQGAGLIDYASNFYVSENFFNSDSKIEFGIAWYVYSNNAYNYKVEIYNEDGLILNTIQNAQTFNAVQVGTDWKMLFIIVPHGNQTQYMTDVYALPGQYSGLKIPSTSAKTIEATATLFPNPVTATATLRYQLPTGDNEGTLQVYDIAGKPVRTYTVTNSFGDLMIERGSLPAGVYTYKITGSAGASKAEQFIIR